MKKGDLVKHKMLDIPPGVVLEISKKKVWRTLERGSKIDWSLVDPEPHASVLFDDGITKFPTVDLVVVK